MPKPDPCLRETQSARLRRLEGDLIAWSDALHITPPELLTIMGILSCHIIAGLESVGAGDHLESFITTLRDGTDIARKGLRK